MDDGWLIINGQVYEELMRKVSRQVYQARWAREKRAREKMAGGVFKPEVGQKDIEDRERGIF